MHFPSALLVHLPHLRELVLQLGDDVGGAGDFDVGPEGEEPAEELVAEGDVDEGL